MAFLEKTSLGNFAECLNLDAAGPSGEGGRHLTFVGVRLSVRQARLEKGPGTAAGSTRPKPEDLCFIGFV